MENLGSHVETMESLQKQHSLYKNCVIEMFCAWKENLVRQERDLLDSFCKQLTKLWKVTEFQKPTRVQTLRLFLD